MSRLSFNNVFVALLLVSAVCAFLVPVRHANRVRGWVDAAFAPVAYPIRRVAQMAMNRGLPAGASPAGQIPTDAERQIAELQGKVASLTIQLAELRRLYKDRDLVGNAEQYSIPVKVIGGDSSSRDALLLAGTSADGLEVGMGVLYRDFVVGKITAVGGGGAQVRLITDSGFRVNGLFARLHGSEYTPIATDPPQVEGIGRGLMTITNLSLSQVKDVHVDDVVQLYDPEDWPTIANGSFIGRVVKIEPHPKSQLFAQITVRPWPLGGLQRLNEVMVLTLKPTTSATTETDSSHPGINRPEKKTKN